MKRLAITRGMYRPEEVRSPGAVLKLIGQPSHPWELQPLHEDCLEFRCGEQVGLVTCCREHDGVWWLHLSISRPKSLPTWEDLVQARDCIFGPNRKCYQVLAPRYEHVNIHPYCLHLWSTEEIIHDPLPDFTHGMGAL